MVSVFIQVREINVFMDFKLKSYGFQKLGIFSQNALGVFGLLPCCFGGGFISQNDRRDLSTNLGYLDLIQQPFQRFL